MSLRENIIKEARRIQEDSLYSAKGHFVAASVWGNVRLFIGLPTAAMAAVAGASALSDFDSHNVVAGVLAIIVSGLTAMTTFLNPNERASAHLRAGNRFNSLKNAARTFRGIECLGTRPDEDLAGCVKELAKERDRLNEDSAQIPGWAYRWAKRGIEKGEAAYQVDTEDGV